MKSEFWKWLKYVIKHNGKIEHRDYNLDFWGAEYAKISLHLGKTRIMTVRARDVIRIDWIERL